MAENNWRSVGHEKLVPLMPDPTLAVSTPAIDDLEWALDYLLYQRKVNVLAINGGDGTIHHTLNAVIQATRHRGRPLPVPTFLFLNGGGMNMVARAYDTRGYPKRTLRRFCRTLSGRYLGDLSTRESTLLRVKESTGNTRVGFIFGSELVHNALTMYERFGRGYRGLSRFFAEVTRAYLFKGPLWRTFGHLIVPPSHRLIIDDRAPVPYAAVVASTLPMTLLRGLVRTLPEASTAGFMQTIQVTARALPELMRTIPYLLAGKDGPGFIKEDGLCRLELEGVYTLDGECFSRHQGRLEVDCYPVPIRGVRLED